MLIQVCESLYIDINQIKAMLAKENIIHVYTDLEVFTIETSNHEKACEILEDIQTGVNQIRQAELNLKLSSK